MVLTTYYNILEGASYQNKYILSGFWFPWFQLVPICTIAVVGVPNAVNEDDFGDFLSVPAQLAAASQPTQQIAANQKLVTSAAGPKAIVTEPPAAPKEEKKGELRISVIDLMIFYSAHWNHLLTHMLFWTHWPTNC